MHEVKKPLRTPRLEKIKKNDTPLKVSSKEVMYILCDLYLVKN